MSWHGLPESRSSFPPMISARAALSPIRHCLKRVNTDPILLLEVDRFEPAPALRTHAKGISTPRCRVRRRGRQGDTHLVPPVRRRRRAARRRQSGLVTAASLTPSRRRSGKGPNICRLAAGSAVELRKRPRHASVSPDVVAVSEGRLRPLHALGGDAQTTSPTASNGSQTHGDSEVSHSVTKFASLLTSQSRASETGDGIVYDRPRPCL